MTRSPLASPLFLRTPIALALAAGFVLAGCGSLDGVADSRIDYRGAKVQQSSLEVPPDLTQLSAENSRYQPQTGTVSATTFQPGAATPASTVPTAQPVTAPVVSTTAPTGTVGSATAPMAPGATAPAASGQFRIERSGDIRWLSTSLTPEQIWPQLQAFFSERGMTLSTDQPQIGLMETEWAENRAKLPNDVIRRTIGKALNSLYSTGERDKFRLRVERTAQGSELYLTHRGMEEVYTSQSRDSTVWQPRARDPLLEAEMLSRIMVRLGAPADQAKALEASAAPAANASQVATDPARARIVSGRPATLRVDDSFDRAWRRVGLALDRSGFTVEDRDRAQGLYFVRYVDPAQAGKEEPGFFGRLFGRKGDGPLGPVRYRVNVKADGEASVVSVLNAEGQPESGEAGQRITSMLLQELK